MIISYDEAYTPPSRDSVVLVGGCFDVLHYGHVSFLKKAKALGNHLVIALENDDAIVASKNRKAFHAQHQRAEILESLEMVDEVLLLPTLTTYEVYFCLVQRIKPDFIAYTQGDPQAANKDRQAQEIEKGFSTTDLLERYRQI